MKKLLIVVDMQNDFIDGVLGTKESMSIIPNVVEKILRWNGDIIATQDTHGENYLETREGKKLPVRHCIVETDGHKINKKIFDALSANSSEGRVTTLCKTTFGSVTLPEIIRRCEYDYIELIGVCTDICVVSNAMLLKAHYPEITIAVDSKCCAGVTPETHDAALTTMKMCQIEVI